MLHGKRTFVYKFWVHGAELCAWHERRRMEMTRYIILNQAFKSRAGAMITTCVSKILLEILIFGILSFIFVCIKRLSNYWDRLAMYSWPHHGLFYLAISKIKLFKLFIFLIDFIDFLDEVYWYLSMQLSCIVNSAESFETIKHTLLKLQNCCYLWIVLCSFEWTN